MRRTTLAVLAALALAGCTAVGPDYRVPPDALARAPAAQGQFMSGQAGTSPAAPPDHWWQLFDDARLDGLIGRTLETNIELRIAAANLRRTAALLAEARTGRQVDGLADYETYWTQQSAESVLQHAKPPERQIYNAGIAISYDIDLYGGIRRGIEAAAADTEAAVAARDLVRINVAAETAHAYAELCNAGHQIDVLRRLVAVQADDVRLNQILVTRGRAAEYEQERHQSALAGTRAHLPQLEALQRNAAFRLATLSGLPPAQFDRSLFDCRAPLQLHSPLPTGDGRALLMRRPDIRAAERRLAAATARIGVNTAALYPDIKFGAAVGSTGTEADLLSSLTNRFAVGPMISWNLRQSTVRARIAQAEAQSQASLAVFDAIVLRSLREVESALANYAADLERLGDLKRSHDAATQVAERTAELWQGGKVGRLAALEAERNDLVAEQALAGAQAEVNAAEIAVFLALGGGWT